MLAGIAVTAAEPGGLWGAVKESAAVAGALGKAKAAGGGDPLIDEIVAAYGTSEGRDLARGVLKAEAQGQGAGGDGRRGGGRALQAVAASGRGEGAGERGGVQGLAEGRSPARSRRRAPRAASCGFGGEKVSAAEKATLERLATALA